MCNEKQTSNLESFNDVLDMLQNLNNSELLISKIPTGFESLDKALGGGLVPGVHTICAQPGAGKTTFALNIAVNVAKNGTPVLFFSYEMSKLDLGTKMYSLLSNKISQDNGGFTFDDIRSERKLTASEIKLHEKTLAFAEANLKDKIYFLDGLKHKYKIDQIINEIEIFIRDKDQIPLVVIDYLQTVIPEDDISLKASIEHAMSALHNIADKYHFPVISISAIAKQGSDTLNMFSGAESARIAFGSVSHWGLTNITKDDDASYKTVKLELFKNRYGQSNRPINFSFDGAHSSFTEFKELPKTKSKKTKK